ncbi:Glycosyltransferase involved in cell wall bisynthesis [Cognatiyoonia koreensis]|uniref:Glycosyltransferase involved in cell wall bisynthesis n=1 Tax=Cognatiyoonia koreensis TaxID=364200 RepID=A0A1I0RT20_9RHOB|nr:glycosyltransferase family 4 protein [Cognatiyoonia koreensis]SEW44443.1 Glycosyltransferase involved in cell wall bisynthesis [Cognatiyoonia koreensis]
MLEKAETTKRPRLGLLTPGWPGQNTPNGIATSVYYLAMGLKEIGAAPVILTDNVDGPCPDDIPVIKIPSLAWGVLDRLRAKLGDRDVPYRILGDAIGASASNAVANYGIDALMMEETHGWSQYTQTHLSIPVIVALHGPFVVQKHIEARPTNKEDKLRELREKRAFELAAGLVSPSQNVLDAVEQTAAVHNVPRIVLPNTLRSSNELVSINRETAERILFVGRFDNHKGGGVVLNAFAELAEANRNARLTFVGPNSGLRTPEGTIVSIETALGDLPDAVRQRIDYKGACDRDTIAQLRRTHGIAVIASRYENLNYTLLEAMGAGQAIVSTKVGGPAEVLRDGETAFLVPPDDPAAMAIALAKLCASPSMTQTMATAAQHLLRSRFDPAVVAQKTLDFVVSLGR